VPFLSRAKSWRRHCTKKLRSVIIPTAQISFSRKPRRPQYSLASLARVSKITPPPLKILDPPMWRSIVTSLFASCSSPNFRCSLPMAVALAALRCVIYVLLVLWMSSYLHILDNNITYRITYRTRPHRRTLLSLCRSRSINCQ